METINEIIAAVEEPPESFEQYLTSYADRVGDLVNSFIPKGTHADMDRYLYQPLMAYSQNGGKRHRPLICFAACRAVGGDMARATSAAAAIEHFHTAALIHDDIADEAELRRGEPCMHLTEGMGLAINAGDLALSLVNGTVVSDENLDDATKVRVITELSDMTRRTICLLYTSMPGGCREGRRRRHRRGRGDRRIRRGGRRGLCNRPRS